MLKNQLRVPNIVDPADHGRRQVLNVLLILLIATSLTTEAVALLTSCKCLAIMPGISDIGRTQILALFGLILPGLLLLANHSRRVPFWLIGAVFIVYVIAILSQADTPFELFGGRSMLIWVIPIMLGAMIFHPGYGFLAAAVISVMIQVFTNPDGRMIHPVNYDAMFVLFLVAFISWAGMMVANRAIRDAHRQTANLGVILNNIADGVLILDRQGHFVSANPALLKMIPEDELRELSSGPFQKVMTWKHKVFTITATPVPDVGTVLIIRDQTRRNETEQARDALLATASHEFRTPLAVVMNYLEMLLMLTRKKKIDNKVFSEHLTRALENSHRLQHLVINILNQAQIQAGALDLKERPFNLRDLLAKSSRALDIPLKQKNLSYELSIAPDVPTEITGDPERLQQVLVNLIGNAVKFTDQGGIRVRARMTTDENLSIEITDTGPGIPEEQLPDIFEAFRRASNYAQREQQGAGLGLSIAREIVTRMGGEILVSSTLNVGSTFAISLPVTGKMRC